MTQDFKQHYIATVAAALVAALPTGTNAKPASRETTAPESRGTTPAPTPAQVAASFGVEYDEDDHDVYIETVPIKGHGQLDPILVNNVLAEQMMKDPSFANKVLVARMMQRQREV
jgi:hypothetical protein